MTKAKISLAFALILTAGIAWAEPQADSCPVDAGKTLSIVKSRIVGTPEGPEIRVSAGGHLSMQLVATNGANIDLNSLQIRYSFFDITQKVLNHVGTISSAMQIAGEILPVGKHKISIQVHDSVGRATRLKLTLRVLENAPRSYCS